LLLGQKIQQECWVAAVVVVAAAELEEMRQKKMIQMGQKWAGWQEQGEEEHYRLRGE
jgi:hypothetical protein